TSAYTGHIQKGEFATHRGHAFAGEDLLRSRMIEALMCDFRISRDEMCDSFGKTPEQITEMFKQVADEFAGYVSLDSGDFVIRPEGQPLTRMMARGFDAYDLSKAGHSSAI
ncbi:MAG: coproporphyrinogen III oxidase, partial [Pseudomonadota bacterium]|nr:coproporphyrinogen III oxidase [Pseudomonadota bacterium]